MTSRRVLSIVLTISWTLSGFANEMRAQEEDSDVTAARLPVTRVILYKNGVGYFEHSGKVRGNQDVNIEFTTAQLNDVLKSLTVLDFGKGRITNVGYNSTAPLERRLGALRLPVGEKPTTPQFLEALRGARIEVHDGAISAAGRLLSVDEREIPGKGDQKITVDQISLISDNGEVREFDLNPSTSVRLVEKDVRQEVGKYLKLVASARDQDVRRMNISTAGEGERNFLVSYISEVPVWKCTYRIVIPKDGKPLLQGWAIVDNTVGEDWKNVELSLVAGAPQSFIQEISQPYYARRPVVPLPENAMSTPQTYEATLEDREGEVVSELTAAKVSGVPGGVAGGVMGGVMGRSPSTGVPPPAPAFDATIAAEALESSTTVAQTKDLGDLFQYKLKDRVTIGKNQSAMVPILESRIAAEKVSVWNPANNSVSRALWIDNGKDLTLDSGSFSVMEGDAFAGEGLTEAIKPGEKRLMSYATDLGLVVDAKQKSENEKVTRIVVSHGALIQTTEEREERTYTVRNRDISGRSVLIEHPIREGWKLVKSVEPAESTANFYRFRLNADAKKTSTLTVKEYRPIAKRYEINNLNDDMVALFVNQKSINHGLENALRGILARKNAIAALDAELGSYKEKTVAIIEDQQRLRENMKALKGSAEEKSLVERYAREMNEQEDRVQSLRKALEEAKQKREAAQKSLNQEIAALQFDVAPQE
ncbi:MAG TPA: hypothetical protein VN982_08775 [Candidatus Dormibacteraeota bacterium]|nr:hypothetical protein [Candidatus Dormibacteraeota bacterium]